MDIACRISFNKQEGGKMMGAIIGFALLGIPCAAALVYFLTPSGKRWLRMNGLL